MKIKIGEVLSQGVQVLTKNPVIFVPLLLIAVLNYFVGQYISSVITKVLGGFLPGFIPAIPGAGAQEIPGAPEGFTPTIPVTPDIPSLPVGIETLPFTLPEGLPPGVAGFPELGPEVGRQILGVIGPVLGQIGAVAAIAGLVSLILWLVAIRMVADAKAGKVNFSGAVMAALKKFIPLLISGILYFLMVGVGFVLLVIPGIFLMVRFFYYLYAGMVDNKGIVSSLSKSWEVTRGNWWRTFALILVFFLVTLALSWIVALVPAGQANLLVGAIVGFLISSWSVAAFTLAYLQTREGGAAA